MQSTGSSSRHETAVAARLTSRCRGQRAERARPDLYTAFNPWDRITAPEAVRRLFVDAGVPHVEVVAEEGYQALRTPEDFWTIALGSGLRWTIDQMGTEAASEVKQEILNTLSVRRIERVATNVIYAVAQDESAAD